MPKKKQARKAAPKSRAPRRSMSASAKVARLTKGSAIPPVLRVRSP